MHHVESQWIKKLLYFCVKRFFCILENNFQKKFYQRLWEKLNNYISYPLWHIKILQEEVLICGCQKGLKTFLPLLLIFGGLINSQNILQLGLIELLRKYDIRKKNSLLTLKMKDLI